MDFCNKPALKENLLVRDANYKDVPIISKVLALSWKSAYRGIIDSNYLDSISIDGWLPWLESGFKDKSLFCKLIEKDNEAIGVSAIRQSMIEKYPNDGELISLYVLKTGMGYGHILYGAAEKDLKEKSYTHCVLNVLSNSKAIQFYLSRGYLKTPHTNKVRLGGLEYVCITMRKSLL